MFPERGALNASFMLARQLAAQGFDITYLTNSFFAEHVRAQGFHCELFDLTPFYDGLRNRINNGAGKDSWIPRTLKTLRIFFKRNDLLEEYLEKNLEPFLAKPVDMLLMDPILMNCCIPFIKRQIPVIHLNTTFAYRINSVCFPVFSKRVPLEKKGLSARTSVVMNWVLLWARIIVKDLAWHRKHGLVPTRTVNTARKKIRRYGHRYIWGEYGYRLECPELILAPRQIDLRTIADEDRRCYVGASILKDRSDGDCPVDFSGKPLLYCSLGTYGQFCKERKRLFRAVVDMMRDLPGWEAVVQIKDESITAGFDIPSNVRVLAHVPQVEVLKKASAAITHAGCSSLKECAMTGTPMIVLPWNNDGYGNSARVLHHALGVRLDIETVSPELLHGALVHVTTNPAIQSAVRAMREAFLDQEDCRHGVEFINNFLEQRILKPA
jgi:UDP:flavonoid glycosyltransferase YjiC (YdhE family)